MANKPTKKENFIALRALAESANATELVAFVDHEIELLSKKSSSKKPTKTQDYNAQICDAIYNVLSESVAPMTVGELMANPAVQAFENENCTISSQKISALLRLMDKEKGDGRVERVPDKKRTLFTAIK